MEHRPSALPALSLNFEEGGTASYYGLIRDRGYRYLSSDQYQTEDRELDLDRFGGKVLLASYSKGGKWALIEIGEGVLYVSLSHGVSWLNAASDDPIESTRIVEIGRSVITKRERTEDPDKVDVRFWTTGPTGPRATSRAISAPTFEAIVDNYAPEARASLGHMMSTGFEPGVGGQLLLWWGPPGTGKTYALRALAQAWRKWCRIDYIVDPEQFFGDATYLMPVLLDHSPREEDGDLPWRLLIFEDTGELLSADARTRAGQGLSRLLNVVDGFIGQGLRTLILITTNEELDKLHPAVARPGRCAVKARFGALPGPQAQAWGKRNGVLVPRGEHTLAELFAIREGFVNDEGAAARPIGFIPRNEEAS